MSRDIENIVPLSPMQQGMLFESLHAPDKGAGIVQLCYTVEGPLDIAALQRAWQRAVDRHGILRTGFHWERLDRPLQVVHRKATLDLMVHDWTHDSAELQEAALDALLRDDRRRSFALARPPLMRLYCLRRAPDINTFVISHHHLVLDGWSTGLLLREVVSRYEMELAGLPLDLPRPPAFSDYIAWLQQQDPGRSEHVWRDVVSGITGPTPLPFDGQVDSAAEQDFTEVGRMVDENLAVRLAGWAAEHHLTLATLCQGAWALLLGRFSAASDVVFGTVVSGRPAELPGIERMLGLFINTLPTRVHLPGDASLLTWLTRLQARLSELKTFEHTPLTRLHGWSGLKAGIPLFESILVVENFPIDRAFRARPGGLKIRDRQAIVRDPYPLSWQVSATDGLELKLRYDTRRFGSGAAVRLVEAFAGALETIIDAPDRSLGEVLQDTEPAATAPSAEEQGKIEAPTPFVPPQTATEERLAVIWGQLLDLKTVGATDDFFELGGHSLTAVQLLSRIREEFQAGLFLQEIFDAPRLCDLADRIDGERGPAASIAVEPVSREGDLPLSFGQERLWFLSQFDPDSPLFNIPVAMRFTGALNRAVMHRSLNETVRRHEVLRTRFRSVDGRPRQVIAPALEVPLPLIDLSGVDTDIRDAQLAELLREEAERPFDLTRPPPLRTQLFRLGPDDHVLQLTVHHIAADLLSMAVLLREQSVLYPAMLAGHPSPLPELPIQYADFAAWQRRLLDQGRLAGHLDYWKTQLSGAPPELELPLDHPRPPVRGFRGHRIRRVLPPRMRDALNAMARAESATLHMVTLAGFSTLLARYSGQTDIVVGSPIANRDHRELEDLIGFFMNTVLLRTDLSGDPSFREVVRRTRRVALEAQAHEELPFERLVAALQPESDLSRTPLFQVMFTLQHSLRVTPDIRGLRVSPVDLAPGTAKCDLALYLRDAEEGLIVELEYDTNLFDAPTIARVGEHFEVLLESALRDPDRRVSHLAMVAGSERRQLLRAAAAADEYDPMLVTQRFEAQVASTPEAIAVIGGEQSLTYSELNRRANQLARYLRRLGVRPEARVGICLDRSPQMVIAVLAVLKSGGAYVPLDPSYPPARLRFMVDDAAPVILLTESVVAAQLPATERPVIAIDAEWPGIAAEAADDLEAITEPLNLAYVMYTSGSTGQPKGVAVAHAGLVNFLEGIQARLRLDHQAVVLGLASLSFDPHTLELFVPLMTGGRVVIVASDMVYDGRALLELIERERVTMVQATPTSWQLLLEAGWSTQRRITALTGGEALSKDLATQLLQRADPLWNLYGPTEISVWASADRLDSPDSISIGLPMEHVRLYLLDSALEPVPPGVVGELYIGGPGVARGYIGRPDSTAERFLPDPFDGAPGGRLYRSGDLARRDARGHLRYVGRADHQVKVRGHRIELGEIEGALTQAASVRQAVVVMKAHQGAPRLVAYMLRDGSAPASAHDLRVFLSERLPEYMVPAAFCWLDAFPLTPSRKIDRSALPEPDIARPELEAACVTPRTLTEETVAQIWADLLGVAQVGVTDNFFALGGHSLLAAQLMARIAALCGVDLPLRQLFSGPTVAELAAAVEQAVEDGNDEAIWSPLVEIQPRGNRIPLFCMAPSGGQVLCYFLLAQALGMDQPFYGLQASDDVGPAGITVEAMAGENVAAIQKVQPHGPYAIAGWSFGGMVAFEVARQLQALGEDVGFLGLIDSRLSGWSRDVIDPLQDSYLALLSLFPPDQTVELKKMLGSGDALRALEPKARLQFVRDRAVETGLLPESTPVEWLVRLERGYRARREAAVRYVGAPYDGPVILFRAQVAEPEARSGDHDALTDNPDDGASFGWSAVCTRPVDVVMVPGSHNSMVQEPHVAELANKLTDCLNPLNDSIDRIAS